MLVVVVVGGGDGGVKEDLGEVIPLSIVSKKNPYHHHYHQPRSPPPTHSLFLPFSLHYFPLLFPSSFPLLCLSVHLLIIRSPFPFDFSLPFSIYSSSHLVLSFYISFTHSSSLPVSSVSLSLLSPLLSSPLRFQEFISSFLALSPL